jgi:propionyl-CoA carboxylase beta chain
MEELGGAHTHNTRSGVSHYLAADEDDALDYARSLLGYLPDNNMADAPDYSSDFEFETNDLDQKLNAIIPDSPNQPYDINEVIEVIADGGEFLEVQPLFAPNIVVGFARVEGRSVGIIANQPRASCASATPSPSPWSRSSMFPATCRAPIRSGRASSAAARSFSTPTRRRPCRS